MIIIKLFGTKNYKNSGNRIRSNQNKRICYGWNEPTKEEFEKWLQSQYGKRAKYKILSGSFNNSAA